VVPAVSPLAAGSLVADGDDEGTYDLITGKGYNYETPDADHSPALRIKRNRRSFWDAGIFYRFSTTKSTVLKKISSILSEDLEFRPWS
jgi:hypothetical protein